MRFVTWLLTTAAALAVATWLFDGIYFTGPSSGLAEIRHKIVPLLLVALFETDEHVVGEDVGDAGG